MTSAGANLAAAFDVEDVRRRLEQGDGGYEIVHASPGLEVGVYVLVAPEPDHQQPHEDDELYVVLDGRGVADGRGRSPSPSTEGQAVFVPAGADAPVHRLRGAERARDLRTATRQANAALDALTPYFPAPRPELSLTDCAPCSGHREEMPARARHILVGYDGTDAGRRALAAAAELAGYASTVSVAAVASGNGAAAEASFCSARREASSFVGTSSDAISTRAGIPPRRSSRRLESSAPTSWSWDEPSAPRLPSAHRWAARPPATCSS